MIQSIKVVEHMTYFTDLSEHTNLQRNVLKISA